MKRLFSILLVLLIFICVVTAEITVSLQYSDDDNGTRTRTFNKGETYVLPEPDMKVGYSFDGWVEKKQTYHPGDIITLKASHSFVGVWRECTPEELARQAMETKRPLLTQRYFDIFQNGSYTLEYEGTKLYVDGNNVVFEDVDGEKEMVLNGYYYHIDENAKEYSKKELSPAKEEREIERIKYRSEGYLILEDLEEVDLPSQWLYYQDLYEISGFHGSKAYEEIIIFDYYGNQLMILLHFMLKGISEYDYLYSDKMVLNDFDSDPELIDLDFTGRVYSFYFSEPSNDYTEVEKVKWD